MSRILLLCPNIPYPVTDGAKLRVYNTAKILAKEHEVDLLIIEEESTELNGLESLRSEFNDVQLFTFPDYKFYMNITVGLFSKRPLYSSYRYFERVQSWVNDNIGKYDAAYCTYIHSAPYFFNTDSPKIIDLVDSLSLNYRLRSQSSETFFEALLNMAFLVESARLSHFEQRVINEYDSTVIISEKDADYITSKGNQNDVSIIPNGVEEQYLLQTDITQTRSSSVARIAFFGKMNYYPNEDAVSFFVTEILPILSAQFDSIEFVIIGSDPSERVSQLSNNPSVTVTGFVEDPAEELLKCDIAVAPMRYGTGVQNKVLQAMALGLPVVATQRATEGISVVPNKHLLVAENSDDFAEMVVKVLTDKEYAYELGANARCLIHEKYTWDAISQQLLSVVNSVLNNE